MKSLSNIIFEAAPAQTPSTTAITGFLHSHNIFEASDTSSIDAFKFSAN